MKPIKALLAGLSIGEARSHQNLTMYPLLLVVRDPRGYITLDEAMAEGTVRIGEVSESGNVPELRLENRADRSVLLLDGEELVGAKQNRVLNLTILAPAKTTITIPVSCVEAGRWGYRRRDFRPAARAHFARGRAKKMASVSAALRDIGTARSNQSEVWDEISELSMRFGVESPTAAMSDIFESQQTSVEEHVSTLDSVVNQVGALFAIDGRIVGFDLFDHPETLTLLLPKLIRSYALDAVESRKRELQESVDSSSVRLFLNAIADADVRIFESVGEGYDVRLNDPRIVGGALVVEDQVVHLAGFKLGRTQRQERDAEPSFSSVSARRRYRSRR